MSNQKVTYLAKNKFGGDLLIIFDIVVDFFYVTDPFEVIVSPVSRKTSN